MKFTESAVNTKKIRNSTEFEKEWIAIIGNPNCGKTALFNRLTGSHQKVGNYPGVTVERKEGRLKNSSLELRDLPGIYSLNPSSLDEQIAANVVESWRLPENRPKGVLVVLDANNLSRNIYLALQISELGLPVIIALNMIDEADKKGISIDENYLKAKLNAFAVIKTSAKTGTGIPELMQAMKQLNNSEISNTQPVFLKLPDFLKNQIEPVRNLLEQNRQNGSLNPLIDSIRILDNKKHLYSLANYLTPDTVSELSCKLDKVKKEINSTGFDKDHIESSLRYAYIDELLQNAFLKDVRIDRSFSEKMDVVLTHSFFGPLILVLILALIFTSIFSWAQTPMEWIETGLDYLSEFLQTVLPGTLFKSLVTDGIVGGVGNVIVFLPQIALLTFFISLLEDSGYMSRMAFILDRIMKKVGLSGKSVLPMLSGFACAVPAIMAARNIADWRNRLVTIMLIPLMSCSARLPIYTLLIAAFIPQKTVLGIFSVQALVLLGVYFLGLATAIIAAYFLKKIQSVKKRSSFIMELPPYRIPLLHSVGWKVYNSSKLFLINAGSIILIFSVILWFLASFPTTGVNDDTAAGANIEQSYAGQIGHLIEPAIQPLGFDWKIGVGLITSFAAREILVSSFATFYNIQEEENVSLIESLRNDRYPDGRPVFTTLVAISLLIFFVFAAQCMSTFAIIRRETNSWLWPFVMIFYMNLLAYFASLLVFQGGRLLGFS